MLLCKGHGCKYCKVCSRYVIGKGYEKLPKSTAALSPRGNETWIDHCLNAAKFMRIGNVADGK